MSEHTQRPRGRASADTLVPEDPPEGPRTSLDQSRLSQIVSQKALDLEREEESGSDSSSENGERDLEKGDVPEFPTAQGPPGGQKEDTPKDPNLVTWDGPDDPENPQNWPVWKKWMATLLLATLTLTITFSSSIFSTATVVVAKKFHVGLEVSTLGTSLFVLGFFCGPTVWGPFSERYGRLPPLYLGFFCFTIFQIPVAVAQNLETIMICRFLAGFFGCAPLAIVGGAFADFWNPVDRGVAVAIFAAATFIGPVAGPIVGGFVTQSYLGWRWTAWLTLIMSATFLTFAVTFVPESYAPILLKRKADRLRVETKNWAIHSQLDEQQMSILNIAKKYLTRPYVMLIQEPILIALTVYMALM